MAFTKVAAAGISTGDSFVFKDVNTTGIITAGSIVATTANFSGIVTANSLSVSGNVSIAGTLTYEDVTNVDSIGLITARNGIKVLANGIDAVGIITASGGIQGIGIQSGGLNISTGVITAFNFVGSGNTFAVNGTTVDISIAGGGGGATGFGTNKVFYENDTEVFGSYQITSGKNALSAGPIAVAAGVTVTIPSGSFWTIV